MPRAQTVLEQLKQVGNVIEQMRGEFEFRDKQIQWLYEEAQKLKTRWLCTTVTTRFGSGTVGISHIYGRFYSPL